MGVGMLLQWLKGTGVGACGQASYIGVMEPWGRGN